MALGSVSYSTPKQPAPTKGLQPITSPYGAYSALNPQPAAPDAIGRYVAGAGTAPPDAISRTVANGQNTFAPAPAKPSANPNTPGANGGGAKPPTTTGAYDLSTDPIVQKIKALNANNYGSAVAEADAARKQALVAAGFGDLANSAQFGSLENPVTGDQATSLAAAQNPFSTAANLMHTHSGNVNQIDQTDNAQNLYYSSQRGNDLGAEARSYLGNQASAQDQVRTALTQILQGLLSEKQNEGRAEADAIETARQNAIANALAGGQSFIGYDANGNPIFGSKTGTTTKTTIPPPPSSTPLVTPDGTPAANSPDSPAAGYGQLNPPAHVAQADALSRYLANKLRKG